MLYFGELSGVLEPYFHVNNTQPWKLQTGKADSVVAGVVVSCMV